MQQVRRTPAFGRAECRAAKRHLLLYRTAKLRMGSREFLCLLRNVSQTGFAIRVLGDIRIEPTCVVELANEVTYPAHLAWQQGDSAGFQFDNPVDVQGFITPIHKFRPRPIRLNVNCQAWISTGQAKSEVHLIDISAAGAKLRATQKLYPGDVVQLSLEGLGSMMATVRWSNGKAVGLMFKEPLKFAQLAEWSTARAAVQQADDQAKETSQPFSPPAKVEVGNQAPETRPPFSPPASFTERSKA